MRIMPFPSIASPPDLFPTYLIPSLSFRRRRSSIDTNISSPRSDSISSSSGSQSTPPNESFLSGHASHLRCSRCLSDLALANQIISKGFTGRHGRAYLVAPSMSSISANLSALHTAKAKNDALPNLPNTFTHRPVPRQLVTGAHTVSDISCAHCGANLGWKYVSAEEAAQKYKVGKFILETKKVCRVSTWENEDDSEPSDFARRASMASARRRSSLAVPPNQMPEVAEEFEFDSQDEDECDDLFMGIWTPQLASKRRKGKTLSRLHESD